MLGCIANKQSKNDKSIKEIYYAKWIDVENKLKHKWFKFSLVADDNSQKKDFNRLSGYEGTMQIRTKSLIPFKPEDIIEFKKQKYTITLVDGNRKFEGEQAMLRANNNGNIPIYLTLRKAG